MRANALVIFIIALLAAPASAKDVGFARVGSVAEILIETPGCQEKALMIRWVNDIISGNADNGHHLLRTQPLGECELFARDELVFVSDREIMGGLVEVSRSSVPGIHYWIPSEAVDSDPR